MGPEEFWFLTPGQVSAFLDAASLRASDRIDALKVAAYCIEVMARQDKKKRLMPLDRWLAKPRAAGESQTIEEQLAIMKHFVSSGKSLGKKTQAKRG